MVTNRALRVSTTHLSFNHWWKRRGRGRSPAIWLATGGYSATLVRGRGSVTLVGRSREGPPHWQKRGKCQRPRPGAYLQRRGDPRLRPSRWRDAPRDCFDLLLDYQRCSRSPFLLLQSRDSSGHLLRNGARPFGSAPLGNITSHVQ